MQPQVFSVLIFAAVVIESIAEIILGLRGADGRWNSKLITALVVALAVALVMPQFDAFAALGIKVVPPIAGRILTGIMASRGAKLFHDFLSTVEAFKNNLKSGANVSGSK